LINSYPSAKNLIQLDHDEELDVSNELIKPRKRSIKNTKPPSNESKKKILLKQEVIEKYIFNINSKI